MAYVDGFLAWWVNMIDFPALVLLILLLVFAWVLNKTQKNPDNEFDFADMLKDDQGKPSASRMAVFVCLALSSWAIMYLVINNKSRIDLTTIFIAYMVIWSGQKVAEKFLDVWGRRGGVEPPAPAPAPAPNPNPVPPDQGQ